MGRPHVIFADFSGLLPTPVHGGITVGDLGPPRCKYPMGYALAADVLCVKYFLLFKKSPLSRPPKLPCLARPQRRPGVRGASLGRPEGNSTRRGTLPTLSGAFPGPSGIAGPPGNPRPPGERPMTKSEIWLDPCRAKEGVRREGP